MKRAEKTGRQFFLAAMTPLLASTALAGALPVIECGQTINGVFTVDDIEDVGLIIPVQAAVHRYELTLTQEQEITITYEGDFPKLLEINLLGIINISIGPFGDTVTDTRTYGAGTHEIVVQTRSIDNLPEAYSITIDCELDPIPTTAPPTTVATTAPPTTAPPTTVATTAPPTTAPPTTVATTAPPTTAPPTTVATTAPPTTAPPTTVATTAPPTTAPPTTVATTAPPTTAPPTTVATTAPPTTAPPTTVATTAPPTTAPPTTVATTAPPTTAPPTTVATTAPPTTAPPTTVATTAPPTTAPPTTVATTAPPTTAPPTTVATTAPPTTAPPTVTASPTPAPNPNGDYDRDGLTNSQEDILGTDSNDKDSDGDGFEDGVEFRLGTDPTDPNDPADQTDADQDGIPDIFDNDTTSGDSDNDRRLDFYEIAMGFDHTDGNSFPPLGNSNGDAIYCDFVDAVIIFNIFLKNLNPEDFEDDFIMDLNRDGIVDATDGVIGINFFLLNIEYLPFN